MMAAIPRNASRAVKNRFPVFNLPIPAGGFLLQHDFKIVSATNQSAAVLIQPRTGRQMPLLLASGMFGKPLIRN
ncbi:hypothetical protein [Rhizobium etli]|uniref:Uncharacterized protein n=1 Tax=Rhizobium etli TaxID=29449 RepID=A0A7W7EDW4_RHIET|nr:hypothetical protein [Rhizobium etli]MBB4478353.1 hypothetical protein [Rhizobium etli]MBB4534185.1 hypothetical protein [Rhizobium etli]